MTSLLQPMDQGIIYNIKQLYRKRILINILSQMEENKPVIAIDLLQAIRNLSTVWNIYVKPETIANCFQKAGFSKYDMQIQTSNLDEEDFLPLSDLAVLQASFRKVANIDASFEDYVSVDIDVQTMGIPSDEDILSSVLESRGLQQIISDDDEEELGGEIMANIDKTSPTLEHVSSSLDVLRTFLEMESNVPTNVFKCLNVIEAFIDKEKWKNVVQTKIPDYFK